MSRKRFAGGIAVNWQHFYGIGIVPRTVPTHCKNGKLDIAQLKS